MRTSTSRSRVPPTRRIVRYLLATFAANNLLPARAGELLRVYLFRSRESVPATTSVALMLLERATDVTALVLVVAPLPWLLPTLPSIARGAIGTTALIVVAVAALLVVVRRVRPDRLPVPPFVARLLETLRTAGSPGRLAATLALSMTSLLLECASIVAILLAVGITPPLAAPFLMVFSVNIALAVPSTPAQVGPYELAAAAALGFLGVDRERALAVAILCHAIQIIPSTLLGASGLPLALAARKGLAREGVSAKVAP